MIALGRLRARQAVDSEIKIWKVRLLFAPSASARLPMSYVVEINDREQLAELRLTWNKLLQVTPRATFFQSLDWLLTFWRHFGEQNRFRVLVVHSYDGPIGILPLWIARQPTRLGVIRTLTYPLLDWGTFYGPLGAQPTATLIAALGHLRRTPRDWDLLELGWTAATIDRGRTPRAMEIAGLQPCEPMRDRDVSLIDLAGDWDSYWAARTSRWRNNVRRSEKKLAEHGQIGYQRHRPRSLADGDGDPRWDLFEACLNVAAASWQGASETGNTLTHAAVLPFLRDAHEVAARNGALDINLLTLDGQPIAFNYAYHFQGYLFGLRTGYDPALGADGAGSVLQAKTIADSFTRGDRLYDLGADYRDCKRYWVTNVEQSRTYAAFAQRSPRGSLLRIKRLWSGWRRWSPKLSTT
jgi:CelD/BcsL family acetyltransferase involved in cellulose biosynthesis